MGGRKSKRSQEQEKVISAEQLKVLKRSFYETFGGSIMSFDDAEFEIWLTDVIRSVKGRKRSDRRPSPFSDAQMGRIRSVTVEEVGDGLYVSDVTWEYRGVADGYHRFKLRRGGGSEKDDGGPGREGEEGPFSYRN